ncbi:MAG: Fe-S cluster assembly protein SufD [Deltaproteobacteria bacterium]|nr:Fe-S cluster assembly protein SufD [Deltaproteobacteria bacterium]
MSQALESLMRLSAEAVPIAIPEWILQRRSEALGIALDQGLPTRQLEEWKNTSLERLDAMAFARVGPVSTAEPAGGDAPAPTGSGAAELVFVDGHLDSAASSLERLPEGVRALSLATTMREEPALLEGRLARLPELKSPTLVALQTGFMDDGAVIVIDPDTRAAEPIRMRFVSTGEGGDLPSATFPRLLVIAGRQSEARLFQEFTSAGNAKGLTAFVAELYLAPGARIDATTLQAESASRIHYTHSHAHLEGDARFDSTIFTLGRGLVRSELEVVLGEPGAETHMRGLFLGREAAHVDHFTTVDHVEANCTSHEEYRGVLADRSHGVFRGRVIVRPGAQKTEARQSNPNLLLDERARINTKPQLEIYADDVKASHGSTIGQLDAEALFFLRARGIGKAEARRVLTRAFAHGIVDRVADEDLAREIRTRIDIALAGLEEKPLPPLITAEEDPS